MQKGVLIAAVMLIGASPLAAEQPTPRSEIRAPKSERLAALRATQGASPYSKLFEVRSALPQAGQDAPKSAASKRRVVCGMTMIEVGPELDPKISVTPPKDANTRYTIRAVDPPICK